MFDLRKNLPITAALLLGTSTAAYADAGGVETVVVSARRVQEDIQTVPATVTAVNSEQLRQQNIVTVSDLATVTPSLSIPSYFNDLNSRFAVRGISTGVTTYFADAPCCGGTANAPFLDIASVQVLNGPQGTLFGRSSVAGAVLIYPAKPNLSDVEGSIDATVGSYGRAQFSGVVNVPIIKDHLALRVGANFNHVDGYTSQFAIQQKLDGIDNQQYRVSLEYNDGSFDNNLIGSYLNIDESGTGQVLVAANPNFALYNLPAPAASAVLGPTCTAAVTLGFASSVNSCVTQRNGFLHGIGMALANEMARQAVGGSIRETNPSYDGLLPMNEEHHGSLVDVAEYDLGDIGIMSLDLKNIFSWDSFTSNASETSDGVGGIGEEGAFANANYSTFGANNQQGTLLAPKLGDPQVTITEELQFHGNVSDGLLTLTGGFFYLNQRAPAETQGTTNVYKIFGGVLNPQLGYNNAVGFIADSRSIETAVYAQGTLDLDRGIGVHGLSLTLGGRYSWDDTFLSTLNPVINYATGHYSPGVVASPFYQSSQGYNYTASLTEQVNKRLMFYAMVARAYVPGGVNALGQAAQSLPNFTPTYGPETVLDEEVGVKSDFELSGIVGRVDLDVYNNDFSDITENLTGLIGGTSVRYLENIAAARLRGVEVAATIIPHRAWELDAGYSYNDASYTKWTGSDPFNIAKPGNPLCVPSSPAGQCYLNLTNNPFPFTPRHQGHLTVSYQLPIRESLGNIKAIAVGYAESREFFEATAARDLQLFPGGINGISQAPYATLNLRLEWTNAMQGDWNAAVFANNVTDTIYATGKVPQLETLGFAVANFAPPAMFGIEIWKKFGP